MIYLIFNIKKYSTMNVFEFIQLLERNLCFRKQHVVFLVCFTCLQSFSKVVIYLQRINIEFDNDSEWLDKVVRQRE